MLIIRERDKRGRTHVDWLESQHSFSFGSYRNPDPQSIWHTGFGPLRVINEDRVAPGAGFGEHPHNDMEIVSYVLDGGLEHQDSMGTGSVIKPGDIQRMSAGTGVTHSEYNASKTDSLHFLQIWFFPEKRGIPPSYVQASIPAAEKQGRLKRALSQTGYEEALTIHQDIDFYVSLMGDGDHIEHKPSTGRLQWVQVARGVIDLNGTTLQAGDGAAIEGEPSLIFDNASNAEFLLFDMADTRLLSTSK